MSDFTAQEIEHILGYQDLFTGDFGEQGDRVISDKVVVARKQHQCAQCGGGILSGEQHRHHVGAYGGPSPFHYRYCNACCRAMIDLDGDTFDRRDGLNRAGRPV